MSITIDQLGPPIDTRPRLRVVRARLHELVDDLGDDEWHRPTVCPGWDVADIVAHVIGDDLGRLSRTHDGVDPGPRADEDLPAYLDRINEEWVVAFRRLSPAVLVSLSSERCARHWGARWLLSNHDGPQLRLQRSRLASPACDHDGCGPARCRAMGRGVRAGVADGRYGRAR